MNRDAAATSQRISRREWRVIVLSSLGGALEFYDFVVFSMFARYIGEAFFPNHDPLVSLMLSFTVFAVGYLARPLGGVILSSIGDRVGRRPVFIGAILVMSASTVAMGLLPTYAEWGIAATILMVGLRLVQGFCLGGELPGAITYVVETAPRHAGFAAGIIFFCVNSGVGLASLLSLVIHSTLAPDQVASFGWRIGFLLGGAAGLISFWLRLSLEETPEFERMRHSAAPKPFAELIKSHPAHIVVGVAALAASAGFNGLLFAMPAFMERVMDYDPLHAIQAQNVGLAVLSVGILAAAWAGDRMPRRWLLGAGGLMLVLFSLPFFKAAETHSVSLMLLFAGAGLVAAFCNGTFCGVVADLFPTRIRFSGVALVFNVSFAFFSGVAPLAATALVASTGSPSGPAYFMMACGALTVVAALLLKRYDGRILGELAEREATDAVVDGAAQPAR